MQCRLFIAILCLLGSFFGFGFNDVNAESQVSSNLDPIKSPANVLASPYARPDLAEGYIKELRTIMRGKSYPAYKKYIMDRVEAKDYQTLEIYFSTLQDAYEKNLIDDIELRYAFSTMWNIYELKYDSFFEEWIKLHPKSYVARISYATYHNQVAWTIRGQGYSDTVSEASYDMYYKELAIAQKNYLEALKLSNKPILAYFGLIGTNGEVNSRLPNGQSITELLRLANISDPQNFWARQQYMRFLDPSWGGSYEEMKNFVEDQKMAGLEVDKLNLLKSFIFETYAEAEAYNKNVIAAEKLYRQTYALQQPYKFLTVGQSGVRGLIWSKDKRAEDNIYDEEMISSIDDLLYKSGNIEDAGYYHSLKGHFYVARALKNKNLEDFKSAFESFKAGANEQDAYSTYRLASTYCEGFSGVVDQNLDLCKSLMIKSAEMGSEEAQSVVRNKWGQQIQQKVEEEPVYGLTQAGQNIKADEYELKKYEDTQPLWQKIMYIALHVIL